MTSPSPTAIDPMRRAGRMLQFLGTLEIVLFGMATFAVLRAAGMSVAELQQITGANLTLEQLHAVHPHLRTFAIILALSGLVPGAIFLLCSIGVRRAKHGAALIAILLAGMQLFALGGILIRQLIVAIVQGEPSAMTINVLALGTPMALLVLVIRVLFQLRRPAAGKNENE